MNRILKITLAALIAFSVAAPAFAAPEDDDANTQTVTQTDTENAEKLSETTEGGEAAVDEEAKGDESKTDDEADDATKTGEDAEKPDKDSKAAAMERSKFTDVNTANFAWARPYINAMTDKGLISGYDDGTYRPDNDVTRLEALSLFSRAMGSVDEANEQVLEIAHDKYDSIVKNYGLKWGDDEIVFLMYKGALKKTDLDTYLRDEEKDEPMKRYEAAIIITKALGGESKALADLGVVLDYNDAREVPANAIQYVAYATDEGIMEGMGEGIFSPNTEVKRSQIAVMLSRTVDKTNYTFEKVKLDAVDTSEKTITVTDEKNKEHEYEYTEDTVFRSIGEETQAREMPVKVDAVITLSGDKLVSVDAVSDIPDETIVGKYMSYSSTNGKTTVRVQIDETGETVGYECAADLTVTYQGSPATVRSFTKGDVIQLELKNGKIAKITGSTKTTEITNAVIEDVDIEDGVKITISHADDEYNGKTYKAASEVTVKKDDLTSSLDKIYKGDKANITLQYDEIIKIQAKSTKKTVEGTIQSITIATPQSSMSVKSNGETYDYSVPADVTITINGSEGTLYDFRVGDTVKVTTESGAITKIAATSTQESAGSVTGVVTEINTSFGFIDVRPDGKEDSVKVFCKDDTTTFMGIDGKSKKMKDISKGQTIEAKGTVSNGAFVGKLVIILSE